MARKHIPTYCHFKPRNLGLVRINGKSHYLGAYGSPESMAEYNRLIQEYLANRHVISDSKSTCDDPSIDEVILAFWEHAEGHYRDPDGNPTGELENFRAALVPLRRLYGHTPASEFGPVGLRTVREAMIAEDLCRTTINARVNRIRRVFRWAASVEMIPTAVVASLQTVDGLQRGRTKARESKGVRGVPIERVQATLPFLPRPVAAMVRLQLLTGCRTGEVLRMRGDELTPDEPTWEYRPEKHKNAYRGQPRVIPLGPQAQAIIRGFLEAEPKSFLFSPRTAVMERHAERSRRRKTKPTPSERSRRSTVPGSRHRVVYGRRSYRQAIVRACDKAFPHPTLSKLPAKSMTVEQKAELADWRKAHRWSPLQLRHTAATLIRSRYGLEAAQTVLGHAKADVTQVYAERDLAKARAIMAEIG